MSISKHPTRAPSMDGRTTSIDLAKEKHMDTTMDTALRGIDGIIQAGTDEPTGPKELLMNEKDMAAYLGISRYFLTELRKKHGLKCLIFEGQHCIYYYLPVVDEYFRNRSRSLQPGTQAPETDSEETPGDAVITPVQADKQAGYNTSTTPTKKFPYKPMKAV